MGRVSKRIIDKELKGEIEKQLSLAVSLLSDKEEVGKFLHEFLTKEEKIMLGKRIILYMMLRKNIGNSGICGTLSMSRETIRTYRQIFDGKPGIFKSFIGKLIKKEKNGQLWSKIEKALEPIGLALRAKNDMKARAKLASGDFWD